MVSEDSVPQPSNVLVDSLKGEVGALEYALSEKDEELNSNREVRNRRTILINRRPTNGMINSHLFETGTFKPSKRFRGLSVVKGDGKKPSNERTWQSSGGCK